MANNNYHYNIDTLDSYDALINIIYGERSNGKSYQVKHKKAVIPFEERCAIVEAIRYVDKVVPQVSMDKVQAWNEYQFNVMFVGDDWKGTEKWNKYEEQFKELGVEIVYFPYTKGTSSTLINETLNKLREDK